MKRVLLIFMLIAGLVACSPDPQPMIPTVMASPVPLQAFQSTPIPRIVEIFPTDTSTATPEASLTLTPSSTPIPPTVTVVPVDFAQPAQVSVATLDPSLSAQLGQLLHRDDVTIIGYSAQRRPIPLVTLGQGEHQLLLVGGIHGGWEMNTITLMLELIAYFDADSSRIPDPIQLAIVPVLNPDGLIYGRTPQGRLNARAVDLNRNWSCEWSAEAYWRDERVNAGDAPLSEPETQALAMYVQAQRPASALFYHSAANGIFAGNCQTDHGSQALAETYGRAAGYSYQATFSAYPVTGTAVGWLDGLGIPAADVELQGRDTPEWERNLSGLQAVLIWLSQRES